MKLVRIGLHNPGFSYGDPGYDSHHPGPNIWYTHGYYGYVEESFWRELQEFQNFKPPEPTKQEQHMIQAWCAKQIQLTQSGQPTESTDTIFPVPPSWILQMERLIKKAGGHLCWQFNMFQSEEDATKPIPPQADPLNFFLKPFVAPIMHVDYASYRRGIIALGEPSMREWTRWDFIKVRISERIVRVLNVLYYFKIKKDRERIMAWKKGFLQRINK